MIVLIPLPQSVSKIHKSALLPYTPEQMFALVEHVELYPQFLPWCSASEVHSRAAGQTEATLEMHFKGVKQRFTTINANHPHTQIDLALKDGPFKKLTGHWHFKKLGEIGCKVSLDLHYEFASAPVQALIGAAFDKVARSLLDAFVQRADEVYGSQPSVAA
jgi:ribosome-associated toxin RatA of RatAB toxin-antitoxin module